MMEKKFAGMDIGVGRGTNTKLALYSTLEQMNNLSKKLLGSLTKGKWRRSL
jgi:hypothetical protein